MIIPARSRGILWLALFLLLPLAAPAQDERQKDWSRAKGIYLDKTGPARSTQAAQFFVLLPENDHPVSTEYAFHSGDELKFQIALKDSAYVYVLNRTIDDQSSAEPGPWHVLLPVDLNRPLRVGAGVTTDADKFTMDNQPGREILSVIVSPRPVNVGPLLNETAPSKDSRGSAISNVENSLAAWSTNCDAQLAPSQGYQQPGEKGIVRVEKESYVYAKDSRKPFAFQVNLKHLP